MSEIGAQVRIKTGAPQLSNMLIGDLNKYEGWGKYRVEVDCEYASFVEYGTHSASGRVSYTKSGDMFVFNKIKEWVSRKYSDLSETEIKRTTYRIYKHLMENGALQHPFFRPAMDHVFNEFSTFGKDKTPKDLAYELAEEVRKKLADNGMANGELYNSVKVVKV